jgi:protein-tyrosine-phosphatase
MLKPPILIANAQDRAAKVAVRSLLRAGFPVIPAVFTKKPEDSTVCGLRCLKCPDPLSAQAQFRDWLAEYLEKHASLIVLPIHEAVVHGAAQLIQDGAARKRFVLPNSEGLRLSLSKYNATQDAVDAGLVIPQTVFLRPPGVRSNDFLEASIDFPCMLKWDNYEDESGRYHKGANALVNDPEELAEMQAELASCACGVIAQALVPGRGAAAFFLRHQGKTVLRFAHRRLHEVPWTGGVSAYCESSDDREVMDAGERLLDSVNYEGVAMVEFRKEANKPPVFLEVNGRLWGSVGLAVAAGADFPRAMVECHLNGTTLVDQPDLSSPVRWHDPGLEMDYVRSLWKTASRETNESAPRFRGTLRALANMIDPRVKSDWGSRRDLKESTKQHIGLCRRELAWLKSEVISFIRPPRLHPLLAAAAERTRRWAQGAAPANKILFICFGNICRSPYAEARWNSWRRQHTTLPLACSAGLYDEIGRRTPARFQSAGLLRDVDLSQHRSRRVSASELAEADLVFVMDLRNLRDIQAFFPAALPKTMLLGALCNASDLEIPDPYGQAIGAGGQAYRRIDEALECLRAVLLDVT